MPITTASEAPLETPRMPGSASGLRVTACIVAPASASAAPTRTASTVRGMRGDDGRLGDRRRVAAERGDDLVER